jgi:hypothetical protein
MDAIYLRSSIPKTEPMVPNPVVVESFHRTEHGVEFTHGGARFLIPWWNVVAIEYDPSDGAPIVEVR